MVSNTYNDLIQSHILYDVNLCDIFHSDFDNNFDFFQKYYETINKKLVSKTRDVMRTRFVSDLLKGSNDLANVFYKKYLKDCNSPQMVEKTSNLYQNYMKIINENLNEKVNILPTNDQNPLDFLSQFKNKVVYLDFWAS